MKNIEGKVVVITGASSGLGEATARHLSELGATIVLGARRFDRIQALADEIKKNGGKALAVATDVTKLEQVKALVDAAVKEYNLRTTIISPGAVATELPNSITEEDIAKGTKDFYEHYAIPANSFARAVAFAISQPEDVDINEILFRPTKQAL